MVKHLRPMHKLYRNQSIDQQFKTADWFLYHGNVSLKKVYTILIFILLDFYDDEDEDSPGLPTKNDEEFKPFIRKLPEFKFW